MTLPESLVYDITGLLRKIVSPSLTVKSYSPASGGCINNGGKLITSAGDFFIKWNDLLRYPGMFEAEAKGLKLLHKPDVIAVPNVISTGTSGSFQFIIMEFVDQKPRSQNYWEQFGQRLAKLHLNTSDYFGLDHNNYMGSLPQSNASNLSWIDFFINLRLNPQLDLARAAGLIDSSLHQRFEKLFDVLPDLLVEEKPSLLHGDLWSGNLITSRDGLPCLIDPAVYYGNREIDLAMTQLFGGFNSTFLESYHDTFPLSPDFDERLDLYNLYPLLVHVNLFGASYVMQVQSIVKRFVA